jgi:hypothetical protein
MSYARRGRTWSDRRISSVVSLLSDDDESEPSSSQVKRTKMIAPVTSRAPPIVIADEDDEVEEITPTQDQHEPEMVSIGHVGIPRPSKLIQQLKSSGYGTTVA